MQNLVRVTVPCISQPFVLLTEEAYKILVSLSPMHLFSSSSELRMVGRTVS